MYGGETRKRIGNGALRRDARRRSLGLGLAAAILSVSATDVTNAQQAIDAENM
jgi:hypothetical protein